MPDHRIEVNEKGKMFQTLEDIFPEGNMFKVLIIVKAPTPDCVEKGHYLQGSQGASFWSKLKDYGIFNTPPGEYEDDYLAEQGFGIISISKHPGRYGDEPHPIEYLSGVDRLLRIMNTYKPKVLIFAYKSILERTIRYAFRAKNKPVYGFNEDLEELFKAKVFVFPMPGTPCSALDAHESMLKLKDTLENL